LVEGTYLKLSTTTGPWKGVHLKLSTTTGPWKGVVGVAEHLGSDTFLHIHVDGIGLVTARVGGDFPVNHGDTVFLTPDEGRVHRFDQAGKAIRS
ncbi:TOBE domain-containing protein, partial [Rhizobium sp. Leaf391]|uniref:TOBE domain-containing protein n=1 Tax=Rhizobium sp. Leaf391 TaxID=1736360 RepID=UPI0012E3321D